MFCPEAHNKRLRSEEKLRETFSDRIMYEREEVRFLWQIVHNDLENTKARQWKLTYYVLLVYGALIALFINKPSTLASTSVFCVALGIGLLAMIIGILTLRHMNESIKSARERLDRVNSYVTYATLRIWKHKKNEEKKVYFPFHLFSIIIGYIFLWVVLCSLRNEACSPAINCAAVANYVLGLCDKCPAL